jgi:hypothetical protein
MDPNANIEEQRAIAARMLHGERPHSDWIADAARLAELVIALDGWLCSGGALPRTWVHA